MRDPERSKMLAKAARERSHPHPVRSAICDLLPADSAMPSTVIARELDLTLAVINYHAAVLVDVGFVEQVGPGLYRRVF